MSARGRRSSRVRSSHSSRAHLSPFLPFRTPATQANVKIHFQIFIEHMQSTYVYYKKIQIYFELLYVRAFSSLVKVSKTVFPV